MSAVIFEKIEHITNIFDWLQHQWERNEKRISLALVFVYLFALAGVELKRQGLFPAWLPQPPDRHFYAIHLAFTLILICELLSFIFVLPSSLSRSMAKQLEILTLILLRNAFKELGNLPEPVVVDISNLWTVVDIGASAVGALCVFMCLGIYRRIVRPQGFIQSPEQIMRYVMCKKMLALALIAIFAGVGGRDLIDGIRQGGDQRFFETIYTVLIFADIAMVLIAQRYMPGYFAVFRNSGYVIGTLMMRLALSAPTLWSPVIGLFAALFVLALTWGTNALNPMNRPATREPSH